MKMIRSIVPIAFAAFMVGCGASPNSQLNEVSDPGPCNNDKVEGWPTTAYGVTEGDTLEDFGLCLQDERGKEYNIGRFLGNVILVDSGAGWCPPCQDEAPDIQAIYEDYQDQGFLVLMGMIDGWSTSSEPTDAFITDWKNEYGLDFPVLKDPNWVMRKYYRPEEDGAVPLNILIDRDGVVVYNRAGAINVTQMRGLIETALAKPATLNYE